MRDGKEQVYMNVHTTALLLALADYSPERVVELNPNE